MSLLLKKIQHIDERAADVLKLAGLYTDSDIEVLTPEELLQLFPAVMDLKLRRTIFHVIHKPREVELVLNKLKGFIPIESFRAALTDNGVLVDYLRILKDMKTQMDNVQGFLDAHISLMEEFSKKSSSVTDCSVEPHSGKSDDRAPGPSPSVTSGPVKTPSHKNDGRARGATAMLYKMVVGGKTFDTHLKLMETVTKRLQNQLRHCEGNRDNQITFVFCPISSRIASDVEAAMSNVTDDKPVILVLMHHTHEVRPTSMRTWRDDARVVLHVNVFYHETVGLLKCERNDAAVTEIQTKLMECFIQGVGTDVNVPSGNWWRNDKCFFN
ncbi:uncharacterized protein LOC116393625 isoform X2 [Anarrhichthys ocellatus]|uniref:uncharacterized protein LOC116393625 isoform X2 n=1 Tax=Anarrhichthys ocellatus TaxID=433405 RepID=UPI0012ECCFD1|nr:uncharacterized protein LOC116393625 isoform X2 [Anarrhichthys ocellatus]